MSGKPEPKYELTPYEKAAIICAECEKSDRLYKDAHGIFCSRCGPSAPVKARNIGGHVRPYP